jgi:hypothetical protein
MRMASSRHADTSCAGLIYSRQVGNMCFTQDLAYKRSVPDASLASCRRPGRRSVSVGVDRRASHGSTASSTMGLWRIFNSLLATP